MGRTGWGREEGQGWDATPSGPGEEGGSRGTSVREKGGKQRDERGGADGVVRS